MCRKAVLILVAVAWAASGCKRESGGEQYGWQIVEKRVEALEGKIERLERQMAALDQRSRTVLDKMEARYEDDRVRANESSAIASLKALVVAEERFKTEGGRAVYGTLSALSATQPPLIEFPLGRGKKGGYTFTFTLGTPADTNYLVRANPVAPRVTGNRFFFVDSTAIIRFLRHDPAGSGDSPIE